MKILLVGGGTGGPVIPLMAISEQIKKNHPRAEFLLVGTKTGPEKQIAEQSKMAFVAISSGKLRRYFSLKNFVEPFYILAGFIQSFKVIRKFGPDCVFATGSFVQVPVVWAAKILGIPVVLHQPDILPNLANKLSQFAARKITVSFASTLSEFSSSFGIFYKKGNSDKIVLTGNPFRESLKTGSKEKAVKEFNLNDNFPTLLVLGGGTGAKFINNLIWECLPVLTKSVQIIHSTGRGKFKLSNFENYHAYEFIENMQDAYAAADVVLSRAGLSTITELSYLKKISIIIPLPDSPQEANALFLASNQAALVLTQDFVTKDNLTALIRRLLFAAEAQNSIKENIHRIMPKNANEKIAEIIEKLALEHF